MKVKVKVKGERDVKWFGWEGDGCGDGGFGMEGRRVALLWFCGNNVELYLLRMVCKICMRGGSAWGSPAYKIESLENQYSMMSF